MGERASAGFWSQTWLLFYKNLLTKKRQEVKKLLGEILVPIIYLAILAYLVTLNNVSTYPSQTTSYEEPQDISDSSLNLIRFSNSHKKSFMKILSNFSTIHVVPNDSFATNFTQEWMQSVWTGYGYTTLLSFKYYGTEDELVSQYENQTPNNHVDLALILPNKTTNSGGFFNYSIRIDPNLGAPSPTVRKAELNTCRGRTFLEPGLESEASCPVNGYFSSNFLALQSIVEQALVRLRLNEQEGNDAVMSSRVKPGTLKVTMENFPKEEYSDGMPVTMRVLIPLYSVIPMVQIINNLLVLIVTEKEQKIKDGLRMIGVSDAAYWLSWVGLYGILVTLFSIMFTIIMFTMGVLRHLNPMILFLLFFLFGFSVITFAFALTPFFHKPKTAGIVGTLVLQFASFLFLVQTFVEDASSYILFPIKLISSLAFTSGLDHACRYEYSGGISWTDLVPGGRGDVILYSLIFLIFDIFFYGFIAVYLDNVIPNEFGVKKHPLYCFLPSFWKESKSNSIEFAHLIDEADREISHEDDLYGDHIEPVEANLLGKEVIRVRNISKTYTSWMSKKPVQAVKDISLNIYQGQITAILGRNGAGKSTLFNILTGLVSPTSGKAVVFGLDTSRPFDQAKLRKMTGVCLQSDLHFSALTVEEHLKFYGTIRGMNKKDLAEEITKILQDLKLTEKRSVNAEKLSGGQKRKLSVAIALIGDPKVILLDEPTAGFDPVSRRHLWTLLQQKKEGKVILLTTHFMDEADVLADRKAIVHDGVLRCAGSSLFLKSRYGVGYYLTVEMNDRNVDPIITDKIIEKWIPEAVLSRKVVAHEVKYSLPHAQAPKFSSIFAEFESEMKQNDTLKGYGVSMTTLEEVFLKISNDLEPLVTERAVGGGDIEGNQNQNEEQNLIQDFGPGQHSEGSIFWAMCLLRFRRLIRSPQAIFFQLVMPLILVAVGLTLSRVTNTPDEYLIVSNPSGIYCSSELHVAVNEQSSPDNFSSFLSENKIGSTYYSGIFQDLLKVNPGHGSMAAVTISHNGSGPVGDLVANMRINGTFLHAPAIMLDLISKYFNKLSQNKTLAGSEEASVGRSNLEYRPFRKQSNMILGQASLYAMFLIGPAFVFSCIGMVMEIVKDREIKARNHLRVNGLSFAMYFSSIFFVFGCLSLIVTISQLCMIWIFQVQAFMNPYAMFIFSTLILLYILPALLFSAIFSYMFDKMDSAQSVFSQVASWSGTIVAIIIFIVDSTVANRNIIKALHTAFSFVDIFYIPFGAFYWTIKPYLAYTIQNENDDGLSFSNYNTYEIRTMYICMLIQIPLFCLLLVVVDVLKNGGRPLQAIMSLLKLQMPSSMVHNLESGDAGDPINDDDVIEEKSKISRYFSGAESNNKCVVAAKNVKKSYKQKGKTKPVLNGVNLMIEEGEVFGLLGHNGAGKTTTMKMVTAEESPDSGNIHLCSYDITSNVSKAFRQLGFCPQHDALWENITLREHLELYATIRGIPREKRQKLVAHFLQGLKISDHAEKHAEKLSGGTKRKLSYAMSMLGAPKIVLLDEPSTGMDPQSKRFLWNTVLGTFKDSRGAMLTTHSMEEADVLCSRIAIMVKGSILCIGSPQHLKNKFGTGYTMEIKLKPELGVPTEGVNPSQDTWETPDISRSPKRLPSPVSMPMVSVDSPTDVPSEFRFITQHFPSSRLVEVFGNRAVFSMPNNEIHSISETFSTLEKLKSTHSLEEYSFSQTTLEQVFLTFAKYNDENEDH